MRRIRQEKGAPVSACEIEMVKTPPRQPFGAQIDGKAGRKSASPFR
jgi:hypothetical protein